MAKVYETKFKNRTVSELNYKILQTAKNIKLNIHREEIIKYNLLPDNTEVSIPNVFWKLSFNE